MAARQPTPAELKEALSLLKQLKKGYADLGGVNPFANFNADNIQDVITQAGGVKNILTDWTLQLDKVEDNLESVGKSAKGIYQQFNNIVGELKKGNQNITLGSKSMNIFQKTAEKLKNDQQGITRLSKTELETLKKQNKQALSNLDIANQALQQQINNNELQEDELIKAQALIAEREEEATAIKDLLALTDARLKKEKEIEKTLGIAPKLLNGLKKIPVIGDVLDIDGAKQAMIEAAEGGASGFQAMGAGVKALGPSLKAALGPLALISLAVEAVQMLVGAMFEADKRVTALSRNLQISKEEAQGIDEYFKSIKGNLETQYNLTKEIYQAQAELSELSATSTLYSKETLDAQIQLTKEFGLQAQDAANLNKLFITNDEVATDALDTAAKTTSQFFKQTGILFSERKLLEQASKISGQLLVSFKGSTAELIKAVAQANKLGITLDQAKGISESMLDFEQSISAELEAELLTGKDLNLDRARGLSLQGKFAEAAEEALKNVGSLEDFQQMNVIQQQALAKAAGLTVDQLSDALIQQKLVTKESQDQYARLKEAGREELARKFALGEYDQAEIEAANKRLDAQEKFNLSIDKVKEVFTDLVDGGALDAIADAAKAVADTIASGGSLFSFFGESDLTKNLNKKSLETAQNTEKELNEKIKNKEELTKGEQERLKKAQDRLKEEADKKREDQITDERASARTGYIREPINKEIPAKDYIIKTLPEDTVVGAGGTKLGRTDEMVTLLKDLIVAVKEGGNVYFEADKVGTTNSKHTFKLNS
jgi:hypothetical protein